MLYKVDLSKIQNLSPVISKTAFTEISSTSSTTHSSVVKSAPATWGTIKSISVSSPSIPRRRRFRPFPISALIIIPVIPVSVMERIFFVISRNNQILRSCGLALITVFQQKLRVGTYFFYLICLHHLISRTYLAFAPTGAGS